MLADAPHDAEIDPSVLSPFSSLASEDSQDPRVDKDAESPRANKKDKTTSSDGQSVLQHQENEERDSAQQSMFVPLFSCVQNLVLLQKFEYLLNFCFLREYAYHLVL